MTARNSHPLDLYDYVMPLPMPFASCIRHHSSSAFHACRMHVDNSINSHSTGHERPAICLIIDATDRAIGLRSVASMIRDIVRAKCSYSISVWMRLARCVWQLFTTAASTPSVLDCLTGPRSAGLTSCHACVLQSPYGTRTTRRRYTSDLTL